MTCLVTSSYFLLYLALHWLVGSSFWALALPILAWAAWEGWRWRQVQMAAQPAADGEELSRREREEEEREEERLQAIETEKETLRAIMTSVLLPSKGRVQGEGEGDVMRVQTAEEEEERKAVDGAQRLSLELTTPHATHTHTLVRGMRQSHSSQALVTHEGSRPKAADGSDGRLDKKSTLAADMPATAVNG